MRNSLSGPDISHYDVVVFGAGPAGSVTALTLTRDLRVLIVDRGGLPSGEIGESLVGAAGRILRDLSVLDRLRAAGHRPCLGQAYVWGSADVERRDAFLDPDGPGWRLDRPAFNRMLCDAAVESGAELLTQARLDRVIAAPRDAGSWVVRVQSPDGERRLGARFLVDATGRTAALARAIGNQQSASSDRLVCRFCRLPPRADEDDLGAFSFVEAVADGWWYLATLPDGDRILAFYTDADLPAAREALQPAGFRSFLERTERLMASVDIGDLQRASIIRSTSARTRWLTEPVSVGWCAVGDAAISFDPLSSQGLFNSLYTGLRGAQAITATLAGGSDAKLRDYATRLAAVRGAYKRNLASAYGREQRFAAHPFWRRRRSIQAQ